MTAPQLAKLSRVSWNFSHVKTSGLTHGYHPFHAKFIPQIPSTIIENLTNPGDTVLDPFCGSGTALVESNRLGRKTLGNDISPIAFLISKVKTTYINPEGLHIEFKNLVEMIRISRMPPVIPEFPNSETWYNEQVLSELGNIWGQVLAYKNNSDIYDFFKVAFSSILKTVANRSFHWNWAFIGDNVLPKIDRFVDSRKLFFSAVRKMIDGMKEYGNAMSDQPVKILQVDTRSITDYLRVQADLIITSPPYCFAVDFNRYYRLSYYWFGWEVDFYRNIEIGARSKRGKKSAITAYFEDIEQSIFEFYKILVPGGFCCFTLGNTMRNNKTISTAERSIELAERAGFNMINHAYRELSKQSMAQKRVSNESILIFQKQ